MFTTDADIVCQNNYNHTKCIGHIYFLYLKTHLYTTDTDILKFYNLQYPK